MNRIFLLFNDWLLEILERVMRKFKGDWCIWRNEASYG